ncbi:DUF4394 domain-containing protein [Bosea beijingensis]|uniref:DUF4394 domain-containing protein n=1 Tax=Bosea beijingensis TaxID=3068632 RepID=UPI003BEF38DE
MCLRAEEGAVIADKTVLKMMREMGIRCGIRRETAYHRYNSYRGVVGRTFENVIARQASRPRRVTEPEDKMTKTIRFALVVSTLLGSGFAAQAAMLAALTGDDTLTMVDTATMKAGKSMKVSGIAGKIAGIDVRPADGMLYALGVDGTIYTIDKAGKATMKSKMDTVLPAGAMATVDFNPAADRLRVIGSDGTNLRVNVDDGKTTVDGKLKFAERRTWPQSQMLAPTDSPAS